MSSVRSSLLASTGIYSYIVAFAISGAWLAIGYSSKILRLVVLVSFVSLSGALTCHGADTLQTPPMTRDAQQNNGKPLAIGFYVNWDSRSFTSLKNNLQSLDWVVPSWLYLLGKGMDLKASLDLEALDLIQTEKPGTRILAMIQNASEGQWDGINLARFLADPELRRKRIKEIASFIERYHLQGIVIDFEQIPGPAQRDMIDFLREVHAIFKERGWLVSVAVPFDDSSFDYGAYAKACDYVILMAYDEHWSTGVSGPIASHNWFSDRLASRMRDIDPSQTIVAIGNYGYDWTSGSKEAQALTSPEALQRALEMNATVELDPSSLNPSFSYSYEGKTHWVWFLNAESANYQLRTADLHRPAGYALWRLGGEDPAVWSVLPHAYDSLSPLSMVKDAKSISFKGLID